MEERYMNVRRRRSDYRDDPPPSRMAARRKAPSRRQAQQKRGAVTSVVKGLYTTAVVLSALIVAVYAGFSLLVRPPEQKQAPQPPQNQSGISLGPNFGAGSSAASAADPAIPAEPVLKRRDGVYNILLAATDAEGYRTDIMMVMCYDTVKQTVGVVSVPRDTLVARPDEHVHLVYGKGGVEQRVEDISDMLGIPIDGYIKVNIKGFITLVDYLNGIDFYVPCDMNYDDPTPGQDLHIHYTKGMQHLNGKQAMEVARFRKNNKDENGKVTGYNDTGRTDTQQKLLIALAKKVLAWDSITKINGFVEIFNKNVTTDLTLNEMLYFASQAVGLDPSSDVETATLEGNGFGRYRNNIKTYTYCYELDPEKTVETVNRLINPYDRDLTLKDMNIARADSYHN